MKKTKIIYWVFTVIFVALMLTTTIPELQNGPDSVKFMAQLGYPRYINPFLGVAKLLGMIAILVPGFPKIKEWAYAGFAFDLIGATYSCIAVGPVQPQMLFMLVWIVPGIISYLYFHKLQNASEARVALA
jgi:hypothetical protein